MVQQLFKNGTKNGTNSGPILGPFWVHFGVLFGVHFGLEWAKMHQDDSNEDIKSLKVPRNIIFKQRDFTIGKPYFSRLGGSQEEYERFRKAPKRHLKSFKTSKERVPKMEPKTNSFRTNFGAEIDPEMDPKMNKHLDSKWNQNWNCIR